MLSLTKGPVSFFLFTLSIGCFHLSDSQAADKNLVPTELVATQIAEAVLVPIYGKDVLKQRPFKVRDENGYWIIDGVLKTTKPGTVVIGGVAHIEIRKRDGSIQNVIHGK